MIVAPTIAELRAALAPRRAAGAIGLVPTMGALHAGHLALVAQARAECETVVASIFVNPAQFGESDDLGRYPRTLERDAELAASHGVDVLFTPSAGEMYPDGFQTWVEVEQLSRGLEGDFRPGHFRGVATVCLKLFNIVRPDRAYFGRKDAQQVAVIERMVADLDLELEVRAVATVRDDDGLALSSRNAHLDPAARATALALPRALHAGAEAFLREEARPEAVAREILGAEPGVEIDYCELARFDGALVLAAAIHVGGTRLIDNVVLEGAPS